MGVAPLRLRPSVPNEGLRTGGAGPGFRQSLYPAFKGRGKSFNKASIPNAAYNNK